MSDTPREPDGGVQEGGYGYPTLEEEVTPDVLEAGAEREGSVGAPRAGADGDEKGDAADDSVREQGQTPTAEEATD